MQICRGKTGRKNTKHLKVVVTKSQIMDDFYCLLHTYLYFPIFLWWALISFSVNENIINNIKQTCHLCVMHCAPRDSCSRSDSKPCPLASASSRWLGPCPNLHWNQAVPKLICGSDYCHSRPSSHLSPLRLTASVSTNISPTGPNLCPSGVLHHLFWHLQFLLGWPTQHPANQFLGFPWPMNTFSSAPWLP